MTLSDWLFKRVDPFIRSFGSPRGKIWLMGAIPAGVLAVLGLSAMVGLEPSFRVPADSQGPLSTIFSVSFQGLLGLIALFAAIHTFALSQLRTHYQFLLQEHRPSMIHYLGPARWAVAIRVPAERADVDTFSLPALTLENAVNRPLGLNGRAEHDASFVAYEGAVSELLRIGQEMNRSSGFVFLTIALASTAALSGLLFLLNPIFYNFASVLLLFAFILGSLLSAISLWG